MARKKKTHEEFVQEVFNLVGKEYETLGKYKGSKVKIKMKHVDCGYEWEIIPNSFLSKTRCPKCAGNAKTTRERFEKEVFDLVGSEYKILGKYVNTGTKIKMKHMDCDFEWEVRPNDFLNNESRCPKCFGNMKKTTNEYKKEVFEEAGSEYEVLGKYENAKTKIKMKHVECSHEWGIIPNNFLSLGRRCPKCCNSKGFSKGEKELVEFMKGIYDGEIIENDRTIIPSMITGYMYELDIYLPDLKLAVEYNGKYWHEKRELETQGYHAHKQRICDEKGIKLINVDDGDWNDQEKQKEIKKRLVKHLI